MGNTKLFNLFSLNEAFEKMPLNAETLFSVSCATDYYEGGVNVTLEKSDNPEGWDTFREDFERSLQAWNEYVPCDPIW